MIMYDPVQEEVSVIVIFKPRGVYGVEDRMAQQLWDEVMEENTDDDEAVVLFSRN